MARWSAGQWFAIRSDSPERASVAADIARDDAEAVTPFGRRVVSSVRPVSLKEEAKLSGQYAFRTAPDGSLTRLFTEQQGIEAHGTLIRRC